MDLRGFCGSDKPHDPAAYAYSALAKVQIPVFVHGQSELVWISRVTSQFELLARSRILTLNSGGADRMPGRRQESSSRFGSIFCQAGARERSHPYP